VQIEKEGVNIKKSAKSMISADKEMIENDNFTKKSDANKEKSWLTKINIKESPIYNMVKGRKEC
jgi:hypothetical protein